MITEFRCLGCGKKDFFHHSTTCCPPNSAKKKVRHFGWCQRCATILEGIERMVEEIFSREKFSSKPKLTGFDQS